MKRAVGLLLALTALVFAACGGSGSSDDAATLVKDTFANPKQIRSGDVALTAQFRTNGSAQLDGKPIQLRFNGPFERTGQRGIPRFDFTLTAGAAGRSFTAGATSTGTAGFLSLQGKAYTLPANSYANFRNSFKRISAVATGGGKGPRLTWFQDPKVAGEEDIGGTTTEHVTGTVNLGKVIDSIENNRPKGTPGFTAAQRKQVLDVVQNPSFEFWTGKDDHLLRRVKVGFRFNIPAASRAQLGGVQSADVSVDYQLSALNEPQQISAPANPRPVSELSAQLQSYSQTLQALLGGLSGGGTTTPAPGGGSGTQSPQVQKYAQCLQAAGNDLAKQQRCAALLR